jgi:hypothetical protein
MADMNPGRALDVVRRVEMMCDFIENPAVRSALEQAVPVTMPRAPGALGFDIPLWVGLGIVGLWAALDGFAERAALPDPAACLACGRRCIPARFASYTRGTEGLGLAELEDLRHLYAHNYAGEADEEYVGTAAPRRRHVLARGTVVQLTCGGQFDGQRIRLDLPHLRAYAHTVQSVLQRFP